MAKSTNTFQKNEREKKKQQKRKAKLEKKLEKKSSSGQDSSLESMMAYVDENGNLSSTPIDESKKQKVDAESIEIGVPTRVEEEEVARRGKVSFYDVNKGFGFIIQDGSQERYFVHSTGLMSPIKEGDPVSFFARRGAKGMDAYQVKSLKK